MAKWFLSVGILCCLIGILMLLKVNFSWVGKLPGDISLKTSSLHFYIPFTTTLIISVVVNVLLMFLRWFRKS